MANIDKNEAVVLIEDRTINQKQLDANILIAFDHASQYITFQIKKKYIEGIDFSRIADNINEKGEVVNPATVYGFIYYVSSVGQEFYDLCTLSLDKDEDGDDCVLIQWLVQSSATQREGLLTISLLLTSEKLFSESGGYISFSGIKVWQTKIATKKIEKSLLNLSSHPNTGKLENPWTERILEYLKWQELTE